MPHHCRPISLRQITLQGILAALLLPMLIAPVSATDPSSGGDFHLYLLLGQSNMAGRGKLDETGAPPMGIFKLDQQHRWVPATEPIHFDRPDIVGAGLALSFAESMAAANSDITIGLIPCAVGGTSLSHWQKGEELYKRAVMRTGLATKQGTLKGILWHQGENDTQSCQLAGSYSQRLSEFVQDLRAELNAPNVPVVVGELGEFLAETISGQPSYWKLINEQINHVPDLIPACAVVSSSGLKDKGDAVHFDTPSLREFGKRYAAAMKQLHSR